jgi:hypothetical protein
MSRAHVSLVRANSRGDIGGQLPIPSGTPLASTKVALIDPTTTWAQLIDGISAPGRTPLAAGQELVPLASEVEWAAWIVTAVGGALLVTVAPAGASSLDTTYPSYLIQSGMSRDIGCGPSGHRLWARDIVL